MVTFTDEQSAYVRQLLFDELRKAAEVLAKQAVGAVEGNVKRDNLDGDDARSTWRNRLEVTAGLLDTIGWSVATDTAMIVELERQRRGERSAA